MPTPNDVFFRVNLATLDMVQLGAFAKRFSSRQLRPAKEIGSGSNLEAFTTLERRDGEAVVRLPSGQVAESFATEFINAIVPFPGNPNDPTEKEAWAEANRMEAHFITLPVGNSIRQAYEAAAAKMLALVWRGERDATTSLRR